MLVPPKYILTPKITEHLQSIEASRQVINSIPLPKEIEANIRRKSTLRSSLFSARIEGNPLTLQEVTRNPSKDQKKKEVYNILKGVNWVYKRGVNKDLTISDMLTLHKTTMDGLADYENLGKFRKEVSAIFNSAGIAVYMPPPPKQVNPSVVKLLKFANSAKERFIPIRACLTHYSFEKIHPFLDGNGRVGRLLTQAILAKNDHGMKGMLSLEEYLDNHRSEYYSSLETTEKEVSDYLEFMLGAIAETAQQAKNEVLAKKNLDVIDLLLPRRAEILNVIRDHKLVNFDTIRRRFIRASEQGSGAKRKVLMAVNERTLRYDLKRLQDDRLIRKRGTTKGVWYEPT